MSSLPGPRRASSSRCQVPSPTTGTLIGPRPRLRSSLSSTLRLFAYRVPLPILSRSTGLMRRARANLPLAPADDRIRGATCAVPGDGFFLLAGTYTAVRTDVLIFLPNGPGSAPGTAACGEPRGVPPGLPIATCIVADPAA